VITLIIIACIITLPINHLIRRILFAVVDLLAAPFVRRIEDEA
jgi:hypothetical protein